MDKTSDTTAAHVDARMPDPGPTPGHRTRRGRAVSKTTYRLLILIVAVGLAIDAYVHWHFAPGFDGVKGAASPHISEGDLFRLESALALIAMLAVLLIRHRLAALLAFLVAAGGVGAVLLYAYVNVGAFGPLPNMYEPFWYTEKTISLVAEAVAAIGALCLLLLRPVDSA